MLLSANAMGVLVRAATQIATWWRRSASSEMAVYQRVSVGVFSRRSAARCRFARRGASRHGLRIIVDVSWWW